MFSFQAVCFSFPAHRSGDLHVSPTPIPSNLLWHLDIRWCIAIGHVKSEENVFQFLKSCI